MKKISLDRALAASGVRAAIGPGDLEALTDEPGHQGEAVAAVAADTIEQARAAFELIDVEWDVSKPLLDPDEAAQAGKLVGEVSRYERGDVDRALAQADVVIEGEYRTQTVLHSSFETHQSVCEWRGDELHVYISTQFIWGVRDEISTKLGSRSGQGACRLRVHGRRLRLEERGRRLHVHRDRAREADAARSGARSTGARRTSPRATATRRSSA